ncbi:SIR2-like protein [Isoptericola sp. CG 20/1183]|uniref:SIR2-like protein n=1 Tax=Isoptericola halotolerans TaxID=300560 RepID=A0ABX5EHM6_9MICO|nr:MULTISPECIES: SIR2 family protein [Isoptericola]PRZ08603.1 SIR2-like protein [Isoptericola halotolerans]PRZ10950.1 SIR2-like protein [Isoptericola sp. CG 20/1183]
MTPGHLFVVHGRLEVLSADARVIPTDSRFSVGDWWRPAAELDESTPWEYLRPDAWGQDAVERSRHRLNDDATPEIWFFDSIASTPQGVGEKARRAVETIVSKGGQALRRGAHHAGRELPLIAIPVIGTGRGGHRLVRGQVIGSLLESLDATARREGVDIAVVASDSRDYSALQYRRRALGIADGLSSPLATQARDLGRRVAAGDVAFFFGAGVSIAAGMPSWKDLLSELVTTLGLEDMRDQINRLGPLEQAELIQVTVADRSTLEPAASQLALGQHVVEVLRRRAPRPSLSHALMASMHVTEAATTNYDQLYEAAVSAAHREEEAEAPIRVLPWDRVTPGRPWLLKMHGDVDHPASIVLSRSSFVHYDSRWKPVGSLVQSLMMTKHLVVIGASMTDENLLRFAYEVAGLRASIESPGKPTSAIGTLVHLFDDAAFSKLWQGRFDVVVPSLEGGDAESAPRTRPEDQELRQPDDNVQTRRAARALTVFLDVMAMHAVEETPFLLDQRYVEERSDEATRLVIDLNDAARRARELSAGDDAWSGLATLLERHGAR